MRRTIIWTLLGTLFGFYMMLFGTNMFDRYPLINETLWLPLALVLKVVTLISDTLNLTPSGEAGFILIPIAMVLQWTLIGMLCGVSRTWFLKWQKAKISHENSAENSMDMQHDQSVRRSRLGVFLRTRKTLSCVIALLIVTLFYCALEEVLLLRDRDFFLHHVDHQAVAQACLGILSKPEKERWQMVDLYFGSDPRLPEAIRRVNPKRTSIHVYEISITKTNRPFLNALEFSQDRSDPTLFRLVYCEGARGSKETLLYTIKNPNQHESLWK